MGFGGLGAGIEGFFKGDEMRRRWDKDKDAKRRQDWLDAFEEKKQARLDETFGWDRENHALSVASEKQRMRANDQSIRLNDQAWSDGQEARQAGKTMADSLKGLGVPAPASVSAADASAPATAAVVAPVPPTATAVAARDPATVAYLAGPTMASAEVMGPKFSRDEYLASPAARDRVAAGANPDAIWADYLKSPDAVAPVPEGPQLPPGTPAPNQFTGTWMEKDPNHVWGPSGEGLRSDAREWAKMLARGTERLGDAIGLTARDTVLEMGDGVTDLARKTNAVVNTASQYAGLGAVVPDVAPTPERSWGARTRAAKGLNGLIRPLLQDDPPAAPSAQTGASQPPAPSAPVAASAAPAVAATAAPVAATKGPEAGKAAAAAAQGIEAVAPGTGKAAAAALGAGRPKGEVASAMGARYVEHFNSTVVPQMIDTMLRQGKFNEAKDLGSYMASAQTQQGLASFAKAAASFSVGDLDGAMDHFGEGYNTSHDDGFEMVREKSGYERDKEGNVTGAVVTMRDQNSGAERELRFDDVAEMAAYALAMTSPEKGFEAMTERQKAAAEGQQAIVKAEQARAAEMQKAIDALTGDLIKDAAKAAADPLTAPKDKDGKPLPLDYAAIGRDAKNAARAAYGLPPSPEEEEAATPVPYGKIAR